MDLLLQLQVPGALNGREELCEFALLCLEQLEARALNRKQLVDQGRYPALVGAVAAHDLPAHRDARIALVREELLTLLGPTTIHGSEPAHLIVGEPQALLHDAPDPALEAPLGCLPPRPGRCTAFL